MRISVVIPVHDRRAMLGRAVRSVCAQTLSPLEIIVVDDGSGDDAAGWVREHYPDVVVVRNSINRGVSHARNRGIDAARGDWVALLDSDDEWLPAKLQRQAAAMATAEASPLCHSDEIWIRNGVRVNPKKRHAKRGGRIFEHCLPLCAISPSSTLIDRTVLAELGGFDESLPACEDYDLWLRLTVRWPVVLVPEALLVKYGGHADQLSRRHPCMDRFRVAALEKLLAGDALSADQRRVVLDTLVGKLDILAGGARKRGFDEQARRWQARIDHGRRALADAGAA